MSVLDLTPFLQILEGRINDRIATKFVEIRRKAMEAEDFMLEQSERGSSASGGRLPSES